MSRDHPQTTASSSSNFQLIFDNALKAYEKRTKKNLLAHPLAAQLQACDSPDAILSVLQKQVEDLNRSRNTDERWIKSLDPTVKVLFSFSATIGEGVGLVFSPAKVIFAGVGVLLLACRDIRASQDVLFDMFERIEIVFRRLEIYTPVTPTPEVIDIIIQIMAEVLSILGIATKEIKQGRRKKYLKKLIGRTDLEDALKRLDKLTQDEAMKRYQLWESVHRWLSPPDPSTSHSIACRTRHKRTATWFLQGSIFEEWKKAGSLLWIHGKPGSGKSILCSAIIQDIEPMCEAGRTLMSYFYFDFRDANKQNLDDLVRSLLTQLSARSDPRFDIILRLYRAHDSGTKQPSDDRLTRCLKQILSIPDQRQIYVIIDALDECPDSSGVAFPRERILRLLKELVDLSLQNLHICVTSRPEIDMRDVLDPLTSFPVSLHDQSGQREDIADYVRSMVYSELEPIMKRWRTEDKDLVIKTLSERADGMFRWVYWQLENLRHCLPPSVRRTLDELPESLDATYERVLREIKKPNRERARRLLECLVVATRPLRVEELAELLAVDFENAEGMPKLNASWRWEDQERGLLSLCSSLISIVDGSEDGGGHGSPAVQFSHFSVKEFLTSPRLATPNRAVSYYHIDLERAHTTMARACLGILLRSDDRFEHAGPDVGNKSLPARYAAEYWVTHAQFKNVLSDIRQAVESLFDQDKPYFSAWLELHDMDSDPYTLSTFGEFTPSSKSPAGPLYYAALCGFQDIVEHLIVKDPRHVYANGGYYVTPFVAALAGRHFQLAQLLHRNGSSVDQRGCIGFTPLISAAFYGDLEMIQVLLEFKADINARNDYGTTPLWEAVYHGGHEAIRLLLEHGADPNIPLYDGELPLHDASRSDNLGVLRLLIDHGADVDAVDGSGKTAFQLSVENGQDEIVILLSAHGSDGSS